MPGLDKVVIFGSVGLVGEILRQARLDSEDSNISLKFNDFLLAITREGEEYRTDVGEEDLFDLSIMTDEDLVDFPGLGETVRANVGCLGSSIRDDVGGSVIFKYVTNR